METDRTTILHKEIDLIQAVIARMQNCSFLIKAWCVSLVAVLLAITKDTTVLSKSYSCLVVLLPLLVFWYLDAFYLHKEKCYRKLYEWVIRHRKESDEHLYRLSYKSFEGNVPCIFKTMFTWTLLLFYGIIAVILIGIAVYNFYFCSL